MAASLGVILGRPVAQKIEWERQKMADFVRFATAALIAQSAPSNYDKMRLLGLHITCQYRVHINIACIIRSLGCCCCYDLEFTLAEYFKLLSKIFSMFFFCCCFFFVLFLFLFFFLFFVLFCLFCLFLFFCFCFCFLLFSVFVLFLFFVCCFLTRKSPCPQARLNNKWLKY